MIIKEAFGQRIPPEMSYRFAIDALESRLLLSGRVIGYFPEYRYNAYYSRINLDAVTHVNYFSVLANANGSLNSGSPYMNTSHLDTLVTTAHAKGVTVSVVIDPGSAFTSFDSSPSATTAFINNITQFCAAHSLDGIDLDWEPAWGTLTHTQVTNYGNLINGLRAAAPSLLLSVAVNPEMWIDIDPGAPVVKEYVVPLAAANTLDWIGVMGYDLDYANHSPYQRSIDDLNAWYAYVAPAGVPKSKMVLGVPFYARAGTNWTNDTHTALYNDIINAYMSAHGGSPPPANADNVSANVDGVVRTWYFNGPATIQNKSQYIKNNGYGGIMIWELAQDHFNGTQYTPSSLLPLIEPIVAPSFATLAGGTLTVAFANAGGPVHLSQAGGNYLLSAPAGNSSFPAASVTSIVVNGTGGDDTLHIDSSLSAATSFNGGAGNDSLSINGGTFAFSADVFPATANLSVVVNTGAAAVFNSSQHLAALTINNGATASLSASGSKVVVTKALNVSGTGKFDLFNNNLIVDYSGDTPAAQIRNWLASGRSGGAWNGPGIMTSSVATAPGTGLGYAEATELFTTLPASFAGESIDATCVVVAHSYEGDANLDRHVDVADLGILSSNWQGAGKSWATGDFTYDGSVDVADLGILASNWQSNLASVTAPFTSANKATRQASMRLSLAM
jgi:GH18 family chitinase